MKNLLLALALFSSPAFAADYVCHVDANPDRGLPVSVDIKITPDDKGGMTLAVSEKGEQPLGFVEKKERLEKWNPDHKGAFELTLGMMHEQDVSGLSAERLEKVDSITAYTIDHPTAEVKLFRFFEGKKQTGGTLLMNGLGTRCLPKKL